MDRAHLLSMRQIPLTNLPREDKGLAAPVTAITVFSRFPGTFEEHLAPLVGELKSVAGSKMTGVLAEFVIEEGEENRL